MTSPLEDPGLTATLLALQRGEITEHHIYKKIAAANHDAHNREVLERIAGRARPLCTMETIHRAGCDTGHAPYLVLLPDRTEHGYDICHQAHGRRRKTCTGI